MKKMLVLALVLAVAGLANAGFVLSFNEATQTVVLSSDAAILGGAGINNGIGVVGAVLGVVTFPVRAELAGTDPTLAQYTGAEATGFGLPYDGGIAIAAWGKPLVDSPAGDWMYAKINNAVALKVQAGGNIKIDLTDGDGAAIGQSLFLAAVPEPMTMGLLGLGALFLRKK